MKKFLAVATTSQSLFFQAPAAWDVAKSEGYALTFSAAMDEWTEMLSLIGNVVPTRGNRKIRLKSLSRHALDTWKLARSEPWDLVQVQTPIAAALWRLFAPSAVRKRMIYVVHGFHFQTGSKSFAALGARMVERALVRRSAAVAVVSGEDYAWLSRISLAPPRLIWRLPGAGVSIDLFATASLPSIGMDYAIFVGELNDNKNPMAAVHAISQARIGGAAIGLVIIGDGPLRGRVDEEEKIHSWIRVLGSRSDVPSWIRGARALLAPSAREGLPRVILEALAAGTPVIARANRGSVELLADGVGTVLSGDPDPTEWGDAVLRALEAPVNTQAMLSRAMQYDLVRFTESYRGLLREVGELS